MRVLVVDDEPAVRFSLRELLEDAGPLDLLLVPCGGGGLLSGCAVAAKHLAPQCRVIGVEPAAGDDGARTASLGPRVTFPTILENVDDFVTVTDEALLRAMFFLWERMKIVVEPTGALAACALLEGRLAVRGLRVGVVVSGGNVDLGWAAARLASR